MHTMPTWIGLLTMLAVLVPLIMIALALLGFRPPRRAQAASAADAWPEMEEQLARMEERVENLTTILTDRH